MSRTIPAMLGLSLLLLAGVPDDAQATEWEVTMSVTLDNAFGFGLLFGITDPDIDVELTLIVDDADPNAVVVPASAWGGPELYGYPLSALTMDPYTLGTATFGLADISDRIPVAGYSAAIWFDEPLSEGATRLPWLYFSQFDGTTDRSLQLGGAVCSPCTLYDASSASEFGPVTFADAFTTGNLQVTVTSAEPMPVLTVPYVVPGDTTLLTVSDAEPGATVYFAASASLGSICPPLLAGECLGLDQPFLLGTAVAHSQGDAFFVPTIPATVPVGVSAHLQAAILPSGAPQVTEVVSLTTTP